MHHVVVHTIGYVDAEGNENPYSQEFDNFFERHGDDSLEHGFFDHTLTRIRCHARAQRKSGGEKFLPAALVDVVATRPRPYGSSKCSS